MQIVIFIMAPVLLLMASLAEPLFRFLFTEKWLPAVPFFQILCFNGILYPVHSYNLNILKVKGNSRLFLNLEILKKIVIIILITIGFQFGIYGLILSSVVSSIIAFFINSHYSGKYLSYSTIDQIKDITPSVFFALIMAAIVYFFNFYLLSNLLDIYQLLIGGLLGVSIYLILSFTFKLASLESLKKNVLSK